jgi:stage II sporulation protein P
MPMKGLLKLRGRTGRGAEAVGPVKLFAAMAAATFVLMLLLGLGGYIQAHLRHVPATMKGLTSGVPGELFMEMIAMESSVLPAPEGKLRFDGRDVANFLFRFLVDVNPRDPKSLLAGEIPGLQGRDPILLRASAADPDGPPPHDFGPRPMPAPGPGQSSETEPMPNPGRTSDPADTLEPGQTPDAGPGSTPPVTDIAPGDPTSTSPGPVGFPEIAGWSFERVREVVDNRHLPAPASGSAPPPAPAAEARARKVFIYHSHNRESFLPELADAKSPQEAYDADINVGLLGSRLAERLTELGIGAISSTVDYQTSVKNHNWNLSYQYSLETVKEAMAAHPELEYYLDIHRDSQGKKITTHEIDGLTYARVAFVVGQKNPNWKENDAFAADIHRRLEEKYPGLSRGIWGKDGSSGHGEYNQSVSPNSILIEVGGVENTLEECYRTIDVLAQVIADIVMDAERVDRPSDVPKEAV